MKIRLDSLTSWRFVAGFHLVIFHEAIRQHWDLPQPLSNVVSSAFMEVTYFFLVSGFVFGIHYLDKIEAGKLNKRDFLLGRLSRLYPVYLIALALAAPFFWRDLRVEHGAQAVPLFAQQVAAKLTLTQGWFPAIATEWNPPSWAMSAVALFYLTFPVLGLAIVRSSRRQVMGIAIGAFAVSLTMALAYCVLAPNGWKGNAFDGQTAATVFMRLNPLVRLPEFIIGTCLARLYKMGSFEGMSRAVSQALVVIGIGGLLTCAVLSSRIPYMLLHHTLPILPYAALLVGLAREEGFGGVAWLRGPKFVKLGSASFSMYILHVPLFLVTAFVALKAMGTDRGVALAIVNLALVILMAQLGVRYLEKPSRQWMDRVLRIGVAK